MVQRTRGVLEVVYEVPFSDDGWVVVDGVTMPETAEHREATKLLEDVFATWIAATKRDAKVFGNMALRWVEARPQIGSDPDVMLVEPAPPKGIRSLRTWVPGHAAPRVVVEFVSLDTASTDYLDKPARYTAAGARELWVFDPQKLGPRAAMGPCVLQVFRRTREGRLRQVYRGDGPAFSRELGAWLVVTDGGAALRIANDRDGRDLWPTREEVALRKRSEATAEAERATAEAAAERARREALEARLAAAEEALRAVGASVPR
ncbi:MAG: Uma2 family endonuclease [Deltaproteobacteria bacterium]|nr:Uma2 family endonuclease [Myxococcales bacterium]MDP3219080.1 Uma2 family endonuclease [Deltaproteobacteria bacterium]